MRVVVVFFLSVGLLEEAIFTLVERGGYLYFTKEACSLRRLEAGGYLYRGLLRFWCSFFFDFLCSYCLANYVLRKGPKGKIFNGYNLKCLNYF